MTKHSAWLEHMKRKYRDKTFTPAELHDERVRLEKKYGERIILGTLEDMVTEEERLDKVEYDILTRFIHDASAEMKKADENYVKAIKTHLIFRSSIAYARKAFWVVLGILVMLAVLKYLTT